MDCFNPHPPGMAGVTVMVYGLVYINNGFNPHPPGMAGVTAHVKAEVDVGKNGFNPHPPGMAGVTGIDPPRPGGG